MLERRLTVGEEAPLTSLAIAMATFNAEPFLEEQLASLATQTVLPDVLVVHDDGSTDRTLQMLSRFERRAPFRVEILRRHQTAPKDTYTRIAASFSAALEPLRRFDYLALCDQDDAWYPWRLEHGLAALAETPTALLAFCDARLVDDAGRPVGEMLSDAYPVPPMLADLPPGGQLRKVLRRPFVTGATVLARGALLDVALPVPPYWLHDRWLSIIAAASDGLLPVQTPGLDYRVHDRQAVGRGDVRLESRLDRAIATLTRHESPLALAPRGFALVQRLWQLGAIKPAFKELGGVLLRG